ncbi:hypothetical protein BU16DRAFT_522064 [Lophium mytilinum]|uniref:Letm1 RBD domain-containing protein n=1 Tax=Lophium mytilinum TaxID=390894 RepID=A0A6A6R946_9PEZI|nr:hypothetical protein BU16DRAFT_522064 [Lophium mytilinum]
MKLHPPALGLSFPIPLRISPLQCHLNALQARKLSTTLYHRPTHAITRPPILISPILLTTSRRSASTAAAAKPAPTNPKSSPVHPTNPKLSTTPAAQPSTSDRQRDHSERASALHASTLRLNPPETAYPPPLHVAPRAPGQGWLSYLWKSGKTYIRFYKDGIGRVRKNYKYAGEVKRKMREKTAIMAAGEDGKGGQAGAQKLLPPITRGDWQLLRRSRGDMKRLVPFGALVLLLGEWMPLVALWITPLVPGPCRIPAQTRKEAEKAERRRARRRERILMSSAKAKKHVAQQPAADDLAAAIAVMEKPDLLAMSAQLDVHAGAWDLLYFDPPAAFLRWSVRRRFEYLETDDALIRRDGGVAGLNDEEVKIACGERGYETLEKSGVELRRALSKWVRESS